MNDNKSAGLTARQASAIAFVALLPPATRLLPVLAITAWLVGKLTTNAASDENLAGLILRGLGPYAGAAVLIIYALWMVFYAGFSLRSSASRFIYTIYPGAPPWPFIASGFVMAFSPALACACL